MATERKLALVTGASAGIAGGAVAASWAASVAHSNEADRDSARSGITSASIRRPPPATLTTARAGTSAFPRSR